MSKYYGKFLKDEKHPSWKGDEVESRGAHLWIAKRKPKPKYCVRCNERPVTGLSFNGEVGKWSRNIEDYEWLCRSCHAFKDLGTGVIMTKAKIAQIREAFPYSSSRKLGKIFGVYYKTIQHIVNYQGVYSGKGGEL